MPNQPPELVARVIALWNAGMSAGIIADRLRAVNRNQVMGILYRARLKGSVRVLRRNASPQVKPRERKRRRVTPWRPAVAKVSAVPAVLAPGSSPGVNLPVQPSAPLRLARLALPSGRVMRWHAAGGCAYLTSDDVRDPVWCNAPVVPGRAWCPEHFLLTHMRLR